MEYTNKLLVKVKSDIEHLANKLHNLKAVSNSLFLSLEICIIFNSN
jgi:hypothetical protein